MPAATRPSRSDEGRRERIVDGALAVIARVGPDGLTHRLVAAEAGVSLASTTYWFRSKEDIVDAAFVRAVDEGVAAAIARRAQLATWTPASAPLDLARSIERECTTDRERTIVGYALWVEAQRRPGLRAHAERWTTAYVDLYAHLLRVLGATGPVQDAARVLSAAIDGLISQQLATDTPLSVPELARILAPLLRVP
jgi:TetR/AcrR family transcriptional regulator, regulator of biofilm formation and stress response